MEGMEIGQVLLFFSFEYRRKNFSCALINWFIHTDERDPDTGMWIVEQELGHCDDSLLSERHKDLVLMTEA